MIELQIKEKDSGGRLDKYLFKFLKEAPSSFLYKMLRKKNIVLNGRKASGNEILKNEDVIRLFLSDETIFKFGGQVVNSLKAEREYAVSEEDMSSDEDTSFYDFAKQLQWEGEEPELIYEDEDLIFLSKPTSMLSQTAKKGDISVNEWLSHYLIKKGDLTREDLYAMKPAVANRLDRNTSGIILAGKTLRGLRFLSELIKNKEVKKYYLTVVKGNFLTSGLFEAYLLKDDKHNTVKIFKTRTEGSSLIRTAFIPLSATSDHTLLEVELLTGKSHQIRAHLNFLGFPVIGDGKYGLKSDNKYYRRLGLTHQFLHSYKIIFPEIKGDFSYLSGRIFISPLSVRYKRIIESLGIESSEIER